jgi:hypothetical protein
MTFRPGALAGYELLGKTVLGAAAASTAIVTIPPRDMLLIQFRVTGYAGADIATFKFGGTAGAVDSGTSYWSRHVSALTPGSVTFTELSSASQTVGIRVAQNTSTLQRAGCLWVNNLATVSKICRIETATSTGAVATAGALNIGAGEWVNTTQQIISVQMADAGGQNLNVGTGFAVFGMNLS